MRSATRPAKALFSAACVQHGVKWEGLKVGGVELREALSSWFFHRAGPIRVEDTCTLPNCNALCDAQPGRAM